MGYFFDAEGSVGCCLHRTDINSQVLLTHSWNTMKGMKVGLFEYHCFSIFQQKSSNQQDRSFMSKSSELADDPQQ